MFRFMIHSVFNQLFVKILIQLHLLRLSQKRVVLFPETGRVKKFYYSPARIIECVSEYIFLISKNKQANKSKAKH